LAQRAGLSPKWFGDNLFSFFGWVLWFCFLMRVVPRLREVWFSLNQQTQFSAHKKFFSIVGLEGGCVLRKKLAVGSVRSRKPRITPSQTTHKTSVHPQAYRCSSDANHETRSKQASTQFLDKAAR
jgi:hypothetical protein